MRGRGSRRCREGGGKADSGGKGEGKPTNGLRQQAVAWKGQESRRRGWGSWQRRGGGRTQPGSPRATCHVAPFTQCLGRREPPLLQIPSRATRDTEGHAPPMIPPLVVGVTEPRVARHHSFLRIAIKAPFLRPQPLPSCAPPPATRARPCRARMP